MQPWRMLQLLVSPTILCPLLACVGELVPGARASRRAVLGQAAVSGAGALLLAPPAAGAQGLKQASALISP